MNFDMSWWQHADLVIKGVFIILLAASFATWAVTIMKAIQMWTWQDAERRAAKLLAGEDMEGLGKLTPDSPTRQLFECAERLLQRRQTTAHELQERLDAEHGPIRVDQERFLTILASVGSSSPFIGLLGTVWGIMHALQTLAGEALTLEAVAGPVGEALVATAVGLFAAIPALIAYNFLLRWLRSINSITASNSRELVDQLSARAA